jgi:hypothetical protein
MIMARRHRKCSITPQKGLVHRKTCQLNWRNGGASREVRLMRFSSVTRIGRVFYFHKLIYRDHCRPISKMFPNARGYFGPGTVEYCTPGHIVDPKSTWDGYFFDKEHQTEKFSEHDGPWQKFGSFAKALDYFGDGSLWVIQAPGHMPGNLICCCRIKSGEWIILGSDCAHSR